MKTELISKKVKDQIIQQIRNWWAVNKGIGPAIIGISGGKDSTVVAALMCEAIGRENVFGVLLPNGVQKDINDSEQVCKYLKINHITINIEKVTDIIRIFIHELNHDLTKVKNTFPKPIADYTRCSTNIPPRVRMTILYAIAQNYGGRVINTTNAAESYVSWGTLFGDVSGDFSPLKNLFVDEVVALGKMLKLPGYLVEKKPADGLTDKTDEDNLGFTYADVKKVALKLDEWQLTKSFADIEKKHKLGRFKKEIINIPGIDFYRDKYGIITSVK